MIEDGGAGALREADDRQQTRRGANSNGTGGNGGRRGENINNEGAKMRRGRDGHGIQRRGWRMEKAKDLYGTVQSLIGKATQANRQVCPIKAGAVARCAHSRPESGSAIVARLKKGYG